jgi:general secretion pathway protein B
MSILLNALKKSEAQRQVGGPPDIHAPVDISQDRKPVSRQWLRLILLTVIAAIIAWYGWQQYGHLETTADSDLAGVAESGPVPVPEQVEQDRESEPSAGPAAEVLGVSSNPPAAVVNFPAKNIQEAEDRKQRLSRSFTQFEAQPPAEAADNSLADENGLAEQAAGTDEFSKLESSVKAIAQEETLDRSVMPESQRRASRSRQGSSESVERVEESEPISFWQIPQNLRDSMPEIRITVLVYAAQPEDRFLLVNGVRLVEKEELGSGVMLDEIRRDGAVFVYRNYRFLVKG